MLAWRAARRIVRPIVIPLETLRAAPKVLLHDHLDGGLRPATIVEIARDQGYRDLPTTDPAELGAWFHASAASGSLSLYLRGFAHTIAVMQTEEAIERVAHECGEDLARDGVVYAETGMELRRQRWRVGTMSEPKQAPKDSAASPQFPRALPSGGSSKVPGVPLGVVHRASGRRERGRALLHHGGRRTVP
jgi:hypothetical protein